MPKFDLFIFFRTTLLVFLTIYSLLLLSSGIWRLGALFAGSDSTRQMLRLYVSYQLLTIRLKPVRSELSQIVFWLLMLACLWWLHTLI
ncbi:MAG: hypothetical protein ACE5I3_15790 [Phycisphaerae bacterium]